MASDVVYDDFAAENLQIHYADDQEWYFLPDQLASESIIFKSADSDTSVAQGMRLAALHRLVTTDIRQHVRMQGS